jgi:hypothetical protein
MYYRVAIQVDPSAHWQWKSTVLSSLHTVFQFLRLYRAFPHDRLRVFSSCSREELHEQLVRENTGRGSPSVTAAHFLQERLICSPEGAGGASAPETQEKERTVPIAVAIEPSPTQSSWEAPSLDERGSSALERRRGELERGAGGDQDLPYWFTLPASIPQVLAWVELLAKVQHGEFQP